jgi:serine/threonine protein kinase
MSILKRIEKRNEWATVGIQLVSKTKSKGTLTLTKNMRIENNMSDFMDKIKTVEGGELVLLKELKGTFGFPFLTRCQGVQWFSKMIVYNLDTDNEDICRQVPIEEYDDLTSAERRVFHDKLQRLPNHSANTEDYIQAQLTHLVLQHITPHVCMLYGTTVLGEPKHKDMIQKYIDKYKRKYKDEYVDMAKVIMTEWADEGDLDEYIRNHKESWSIDTWRALLFQMCAMLALIQEKIPSFRHNDLSLANILVQKTEGGDGGDGAAAGHYKYVIGGKEYFVPDIGFRVLMADFDYASIEAMGVTNEKLDTKTTRKFGTVPHKNASFDCHMMLNWLNLWTLKLNKRRTYEGPDGETLFYVKEFIDSALDQKKYQADNNRWLRYSRLRFGKTEIPELVPRYILESNVFFDPFRQAPTDGAILLEQYNNINSI